MIKSIFLTLTLVVAVAGMGSPLLAHEVDRDDTTVIHMNEQGFEPDDVEINVGDAVIFENVGEREHWPASNIHPTHRAYPRSDIGDCDTPNERFMFDACRGIAPNGTYTFQFNEVGEWRFHDHLFASLNGKITVTESDAAVQESQDERGGFFSRIINAIREFFGQLFSGMGNSVSSLRDESSLLSTEYVEKTWEFNSDITSDSRLIATNDDELFSYVKKFSAASALEQLVALESEFGNCHDKAHFVGRFAYELHESDSFRQCAMLCQSGCYHGAVEAYFREKGTADLENNINELCAGSTNPFIVHQCRHGVGHGLMAWSDYDLYGALDSCDLIDDQLGQGSCYSGVFMENIVQSMAAFLDIEGHTTQFLSDDPHYPCSVVDEKYESTCYFLQTDRMFTLADGDFGIVASNCSEVENSFSRSMCFESMGRTIGGQNRGNYRGAIAACSYAREGDDRTKCLSGAVQDTFWDPSGQDIALQFCESLGTFNEKSSCYSIIFERAPEVLASSSEHLAFCNKAEVEYQNQCRAHIK